VFLLSQLLLVHVLNHYSNVVHRYHYCHYCHHQQKTKIQVYPRPTRRPACHHLNWTYCWHCHYQLIIIIIIIVIHTFSTISSLMLLILITSLVALAWECILMHRIFISSTCCHTNTTTTNVIVVLHPRSRFTLNEFKKVAGFLLFLFIS